MSGRRIAILGGTFDPVHVGHVSVLEQVVGLLGADAGVLVPAAQPPHRDAAHASAAQRLEMASAAVHGHERLCVDDIEVKRGGPSYTLDTVRELAVRGPGDEYYLLLGADAARMIGSWHEAEELLRIARFVLINRSGVDRIDVAEARGLGFSPERTRLLQVVSPPVSATDIRARVAAGESTEGLVAPGVAAIIVRDHLYNGAA